ncbi:MAG: ribosome biogenesis GTP-binding protein YihA/YsxC [Myxococcota bacterium]|nr:ribosome biogenesis GTP-binding protein YihA/YsxC [Myxococcota bacterium]
MKPRILRAELVATAARVSDLPPAELPEVAFLGRSNVGKSSLLNKLVQRKRLARISNTPGKTRLIHVYEVELGWGGLRLVDLPGYGYARVARSERRTWRPMIEGYLSQREGLCAAILLQDLRRDVSEDETRLLDWLDEHSVVSLVAITKLDKLRRMRRGQRLKALRAQLPIAPARTIATSAQTGEGIEPLWRAIQQLASGDADRGASGQRA